jgi:putative flippase GtrA
MQLNSTLFRQVASFGAVGLLQIVIDWMTFVVLTFAGAPAAPANVSGRILGACMGYWLNGKWTFADGGKPSLSRKSLLRYLATWIVTTAISTLVVLLVDRAQGLHWAWMVKPVSDSTLAALGFAVSKFWIYRKPEGSRSPS